MALEEKIQEIANSTVNFGFNNKYVNGVALSGWVFQKPKFSENPIKKSKAASFIIYQVMVAPNGEIATNSFSCITYVDDLIEKLLKLDSVTFVTCNGRMIYNHYKHSYSPQVMSLNFDLSTDIPLEPMYRTNKPWDKEDKGE